MKICPHCKNEIPDNNVICPYCGTRLIQQDFSAYDKPSLGWNIAGFFFPLMGFIIALIWWRRRKLVVRARSLAIASAIGLVIGILLNRYYTPLYNHFMMFLFTMLD